jgi:integrase/recombinase XerD
MQIIRTEWPKVRERIVKSNAYFTVDLRRVGYTGQKSKTFNDKAKALEFARGIAARVAKSGFDALSMADPRIKAWTEQAAIHGKTLDEVFQIALGVLQNEAKTKASPFMSELLSLWVLDKTENVLKPLRPASLRAIRNSAHLFKADFGETKILEITRQQIEEYLSNKKVGNRYRDNLRSYLSQFFNWCIKKEYLTNNPCNGIDITIDPHGMPQYFSIEQCQAIMRKAMEEPSIVCYFALALFAGIRPQEIERMTWQNVNLEGKDIYLPATITKTKTGRQFQMSDTLFAWLNAYKTEKPLMPELLRQKKAEVLKMFNGDWIQDGLRHTFATFSYAQHHSLTELAHVMGNSPSVINRFYRGTIPDSLVKGFWGITPASLKQ